MMFYLGVHRPNWMAQTSLPLFVSYRVLAGRRQYPRARGPWIEDSGAFTELSLHGTQTIPPRQFAAEVKRHREEVGNQQCAAIQDWMCDIHMIRRTGLSITEHITRTVRSFLELREIAPDVPWMPVIQGWNLSDYLRCIERYDAAGVYLSGYSHVGVGSVCRRQASAEAAHILRSIAGLGIRVHAFGVKIAGLRMVADTVTSSDSMAWSYRARRSSPLPGCSHRNCANCLRYALQWYERVTSGLGVNPRAYQIPMEMTA